MAGKKNRNGHAGTPASEETLGKILDVLGKNTAAVEKNGERISNLATDTKQILARMETRLDEIARNTGRNQRWLEARIEALEKRLGVTPPAPPTE